MNDKYKNQNLPKANLSLIGAQGFWPNPLKAVRRVLRDKEREGDLFVQRVSASCLRWIRAIVAYRMSSGHLQSM